MPPKKKKNNNPPDNEYVVRAILDHRERPDGTVSFFPTIFIEFSSRK